MLPTLLKNIHFQYDEELSTNSDNEKEHALQHEEKHKNA